MLLYNVLLQETDGEDYTLGLGAPGYFGWGGK